MTATRHPGPLRHVGGLAGVTGLFFLALAWLAPDAQDLLALRAPAVRAHVQFDDLLVQVSAVVAIACLTWLWACAVVTVADAFRGRPGRVRRGCPDLLRRLVLLGLGVAVLATPSAGAVDKPDRQPSPAARLHGLPATDLPDTGLGADTSADRHRVVVVRPGDSLWSIATACLPPGAGAGQIQRRVRFIHRVNRRIIGADPDHIVPAQRLRVPLGKTGAPR